MLEFTTVEKKNHLYGAYPRAKEGVTRITKSSYCREKEAISNALLGFQFRVPGAIPSPDARVPSRARGRAIACEPVVGVAVGR
eukprot:3490894-Prymnesium_polylepis.1